MDRLRKIFINLFFIDGVNLSNLFDHHLSIWIITNLICQIDVV